MVNIAAMRINDFDMLAVGTHCANPLRRLRICSYVEMGSHEDWQRRHFPKGGWRRFSM